MAETHFEWRALIGSVLLVLSGLVMGYLTCHGVGLWMRFLVWLPIAAIGVAVAFPLDGRIR